MDRRGFLGTMALAGCVLARPFGADAQRLEKVYLIGFLSSSGCPILPEILAPLREGLRKLGYVEGQNIHIVCRGTPAQHRLPGFATELISLNVDVLVAQGTAAALAAKQGTQTIPIVMVNVGDPVQSGLVSSLARPGGNVTGLSAQAPSIVPQALEFLKEAAPSAARLAVWIDPTNPGHTQADAQLDGAARTLGIVPERVDVRTAADLDVVFAGTLKQHAEALLVYPLPLPRRDFRRIAEFAIGNRLPTIVLFPQMAREGVLMSYGPDQAEQYRRMGTYIEKIVKGAKPGELPVEKPEKFELAINLKTAKALGLTISPLLLLRADEVIQ